jgi:hypothetical protein
VTIYSERFQNVQPAENGLRQGIDTESGRPVTVFSGSVDLDSVEPASVAAAAQLARSLDHPNVARAIDVSVAEESITLVTEGPAGVPLSVYAGSSHPSLEAIRQFGLELCDALSYLRSQGLTNRLSVEHLMVRNGHIAVGGGNLLPVAGVSWDDAAPSPLNAIVDRHAAAAGTDPDVFAVGAVLYQTATGIATGPSDRAWTPAAMALEHFVSSATPPSSLKGSIPPEWDDVLTSALTGRYRSLHEFAAQIAELPGEPAEVKRETATAVVGDPTPDWFVIDDDSDDRESTSRSVGGRPLLIAGAAVLGLVVLLAVGWYALGGRGKSTASPTVGPSVAQVVGLRDFTRLEDKTSRVMLAWSPVQFADIYHVRVKTGSGSSAHATVVTRHRTSYSLKTLTPGETYSWQVAARVGGVWGPYSANRTGSVPQVATVTVFPTPSVRTPGAGAHLRVPVRLCWAVQHSAILYLVRFDGTLKSTRHACLTLHTRPGRHHWAVAAVKNDKLQTTSNFSKTRYFVLLRARKAHHPTGSTHKTKTHKTKTPAVRTHATSAPAVVVVPTQVPVYVAPTAIPTAVIFIPTQAPVIVQQPVTQPTVAPPTAVPPPPATAAPSKSCIPFVTC